MLLEGPISSLHSETLRQWAWKASDGERSQLEVGQNQSPFYNRVIRGFLAYRISGWRNVSKLSCVNLEFVTFTNCQNMCFITIGHIEIVNHILHHNPILSGLSRETEGMACISQKERFILRVWLTPLWGLGSLKSAKLVNTLETQRRDDVAVLDPEAIWRQSSFFLWRPKSLLLWPSTD